MKRVEYRQKTLARNGEDPVTALHDKLVDEDAAASALRHAWWIALTTW